jgi:hypothetical protein
MEFKILNGEQQGIGLQEELPKQMSGSGGSLLELLHIVIFNRHTDRYIPICFIEQ